MSGLMISNRKGKAKTYLCPLCDCRILIGYLMSDKRKVCYHCACRIVKQTSSAVYIIKSVEVEF